MRLAYVPRDLERFSHDHFPSPWLRASAFSESVSSVGFEISIRNFHRDLRREILNEKFPRAIFPGAKLAEIRGNFRGPMTIVATWRDNVLIGPRKISAISFVSETRKKRQRKLCREIFPGIQINGCFRNFFIPNRKINRRKSPSSGNPLCSFVP